MFEYESNDRLGARPPPGFDVMRASDLDPEQGREDRWLFLGRVHGRSFIRAGFDSRESACRAAWVASDSARALAVMGGQLAVTYTVARSTWDVMVASLIAQAVADAGSIRRAAKMMGLPKTTLATWAAWHKKNGSWPR